MGEQFTPQPGRHRVDRICREYGVEYCLTKPAHPWANGPVERMNRTSNEAAVRRVHDQTTDKLSEHLQFFLVAYDYAERLKLLPRLAPHAFVGA